MSKRDKKFTAQAICESLKYRILHLEYLPGHRFTEQALCEEFEVSRIPIREALGMLVDMGLVDKIRNVGCRVRKLTLKDIDDLYEVRTALELYAVEVLAGMDDAGQQVLALTQEWLDHAKTDKNRPIDPEFWADADERFHEFIVSTLNNQAFSAALRKINEKIHFLRIKDITSHGRLERTCAKHLSILEAIARHDGPVARKHLTENILMGKANVQESFKEALLAAVTHAD